jgi:transposase
LSSTAAVRSRMSRDLGVPPETLRRFVRRVEADEGLRPDLPTAAEREEIKALRRENYELRRANEILKAASVLSERSIGRERVGSPSLSTSGEPLVKGHQESPLVVS